MALGCKVTPRGSGHSSTQDNRDNLRPVLGRLVGLVVLAVMLDVAARRRSASACNCMKLSRRIHPALPKTVKTSLTRRWRSACARGLFFLVIRDGSLFRLARHRSARQSSSLGLAQREKCWSRHALPSCLFVAVSPRSPCGLQHIGDWGCGGTFQYCHVGALCFCPVCVDY